MLKRLYIKNFVIIKEVILDFFGGFSVITGSTGSGKSLILDAISFCIDGTGGQSLIRQSSDNLQVIMTFDASNSLKTLLDEHGVVIDDDEITISKTLSKDGKKRCLINNQPVSQKILDLFSSALVTIYAQHSLSILFKPSHHIKFLDNFITDQQLIRQVELSFSEMKNTEKELSKFKEEYEANAREYDFLSHMLSELKAANIRENEEEELGNQRSNLQFVAKKTKLITDSLSLLDSSDICGNIYSITRNLSRSQDNEAFSDIIRDLELANHHIKLAEDGLSGLINSHLSNLSLEQIEDRLYLIKDLARKYRCNSSEIPTLVKTTEEKIDRFENSEVIIKKLENRLSDEIARFKELSGKLSEIRQKAAIKIEKNVHEELSHLDMKSCSFKVKIDRLSEDKYSSKGIDSIVFEASTNPGSPFGAIDKIASGGEMARFMLALQVSLLNAPLNKPTVDLPLIIFDEIDTGIGGKVADSVGERLKKLSLQAQVLVITHQPQVASKSDAHILISKEIINNGTQTSAKILSLEEKTQEIARMLSGKTITEASLLAAQQLIEGG